MSELITVQDRPRPPLSDKLIKPGGKYYKDSDLVGLHVHSDGSFLDGYAGVEKIAARAAELRQKAVAITDHQEVGRHMAFAKACAKNDIHPVFGMEGYLVDSFDQAVAEKYGPKDFSHVTLLAKTNKGLSNLWAWSSDAYQNKFYSRALQDWDGIAQFGEDLYASDGCMLAWVAQAILKDDEERCHELMGRYLKAFGDNFYVELHTWQFMTAYGDQTFELNEEQLQLNKDMTKINQGKVALAQQWGVPMVVVNDAHYSVPEDWEKHAYVWKMTTNTSDQTPSGKKADHMMDDDEMVYWLGQHGIAEDVTREAIKNSGIIAESCTAEIVPQLRMPRITDSEEQDEKLFLKHLAEGFQRKVIDGGLDEKVYRERMEWENGIIIPKKFPGYFNIVADYTKTAKKTMLLGPGRGSAGGSLDAWLLDITEVDPIPYGLPFERFINPDRSGFPDIDLDFPQSKRPQVKEDLAERFGADNVVTIGTIQTSGAKGILRDLSRIMEVPWKDQDDISKIFDKARSNDPEKKDITWDEMMEQLKEPLAPFLSRYPRLFRFMGEMVGMIRGSSQHASGILISSDPLLGILPVRVTKKKDGGKPVSAFTMKEVEDLGFVKFDVLGLRHLDTIEICLRLIKERHGVEIDLYGFGEKEYSDPAIWPAIWAGDTTGIFQLETADMTRVAMRHKPNNEVEVADLISVNRPGVIYAGQLEPYLQRREGLEAPAFHNPETEKHLERTFGVLTYQEQIMEIVKDLAGFTPGQADSVRSAVSKKKQAELEAFYDMFIDGCLANEVFVERSETGDPRQDAENIWKSIQASGSYAFSLIHATEYAIISCWEVWLRHYYYEEFVTALLTSDAKKDKDEPPKTAIYMRHARMRGVEVLVPDINESKGEFQTIGYGKDVAVRYGLNFIKGIGAATTDEFLPLQPFSSFDDFLERTNVNRGAIFTLITIGAFDSFGVDRAALMKRYRDRLVLGVLGEPTKPVCLIKGKGSYKTPRPKYIVKKVGKADREKLMEMEIPDFESEESLYQIEKELTGSFISKDPMAKFIGAIDKMCLSSPEEMLAMKTGEVGTVGGQITKLKVIKTKSGRNPGQEMAFMGVEYNYELFDITIFPGDYAKYKFLLKLDAPIICRVNRLDKGVCTNEIERLDWIYEGDN